MAEPTIRNLKAIIAAGGGSYTIPATHGGNTQIGTTPAVTINYTKPSTLQGLEQSLGFTETSSSGVVSLNYGKVAVLGLLVLGGLFALSRIGRS